MENSKELGQVSRWVEELAWISRWGRAALDELDLDSLVKLDLTDQGQGPRMKPS